MAGRRNDELRHELRLRDGPASGLQSPRPRYRFARQAVAARGVDQSRSDVLTGIIGARRPCTVSMISALSMPCR